MSQASPAVAAATAAAGNQQRSFKRKITSLVQGQAWTAGGTLPTIQLPTDAPITKLIVRIYGTPAATTSSAGTANTPWVSGSTPIVPAMAGALGKYTINGSTQDGSLGIQMQNIPFQQASLDSYLMTGCLAYNPANDVDAAALASAIDITVPIHFMDERLPDSQNYLTALEAMRYGNTKNLNLVIVAGYLTSGQAGVTPGFNDNIAIAGGTYTGVGPGTLVVDVDVEQLIPQNFEWPVPDNWTKPDPKGPQPLPTFDRNFEYQPYPSWPISDSNGVDLNQRRVQLQTIFQSTAVSSSGTGDEVGQNNLGISPTPKLIQKLGANPIIQPRPTALQADANLKTAYGPGAIWPDGLYYYDDSNGNLNNAPSLYKVAGVLSWDLNEGTLPSGQSQQNGRILHITYTPSRAAFQASNGQI